MPSRTMKQVEMQCDIPLWIPPEVLIDIFKRLPVRTLIQLQFVCKDWKNLLNDPFFIQEHLRYSAHENPSLLFCRLSVLNTLELYTIDSEMQVLPVESVPLIESLRDAMVVSVSYHGITCLIQQVEVYSLNTYSWKEVEFGGLLDGVEITSHGFEEFALIPFPISATVFIDSHCYRPSVFEKKLALLSHTTIGNYEYSLSDLWSLLERNVTVKIIL
ncbi:hypothetical protein K1719_018552 [Acacia pycnantha]|nr:hypothetical protein K1719_018552 [Acacia pycnantha]